MPKRHSCQYFEANEKCSVKRCLHADDGTQYLFDTERQLLFFRMVSLEGQMVFIALMDIGYDLQDPLDELV